MKNQPYDRTFFESLPISHRNSVPKILSVIREFIQPSSVVDVGCSIGSFCAGWMRLGVKNILGIDGDYVDRDLLVIPEENFVAHDLTMPYEVTQRYDLALSFEVAEHLEEVYANQFIKMLCELSDIVVFSASIPTRMGTHHVNEQWQSYWCSLFNQYGYIASDYVRKRITGDSKIQSWYKQNIVTYVHKDKIENYPLLEKSRVTDPKQLDLVHPDMWDIEWVKWIPFVSITAFGKNRFSLLENYASERDIIMWGAGLCGVLLDYVCDLYGVFPNRLYVDTFKEKNHEGRIPIIPLKDIENQSDKNFVIITLQIRNIEIEQKLSELGYGEDDYAYFFDNRH